VDCMEEGTACALCNQIHGSGWMCTWKIMPGSLIASFDSASWLAFGEYFGGVAFKTEIRRTATTNEARIIIGLREIRLALKYMKTSDRH
jgi:hypothetical protein